ncbi:MAG: PKD domain-containing protein [Thermoplasmata archaeon]|nr:PKD domain-containing protein [Thermoplasmata archaeon]
MRTRGYRAIEALAVLLAVLLGATALLPLTMAASAQVNGVVSTCAGPLPYVSGATVTLIDVNGIVPPATTTTNGAGVYAFNNPPPATYMITGDQSTYYPNENRSAVRFDGTVTKRIDLCMYPHGSPAKTLAVTVQAAGSPVPAATVAAFEPTNPTGRIQLVTQGTTGSTGVANLTLWAATFILRASAPTYVTVEQSVDASTVSAVTVTLSGTVELFGQVKSSSGAFLSSGVVAWLYNPFTPGNNASISRLIPGTVSASLYQFETARVPNGQYYLIVDADGYRSSRETLNLTGALMPPHDVTLQPAPQERYDTTMAYGAADWNNLTLWRNLTLNADSTLPGLGPTNLRDLRLQIDATLGNGNGTLSPGEIAAFSTWICNKGPAYAATDGFFTTNGRAYNSTAAGCGVTVSPTLGTPNARVWINTTTATQYKIKGAPPYVATGGKTYFVNMTMVPDSNTSAYKNYTYTIILPKKYQLNMTTLVPSNAPVTTYNFTRITVDPGVTIGTPQIRMTVSPTGIGTARAKVAAPAGKFYVQNATFTNYQAFVANNTTLTFSAEDTTDPNDHVPQANFTWRFTPSAADVRWGIRPEFKYKAAGQFTVNLTVVQTGGNVTYRNITLYVDDQLPIARIRTNRTGAGSANGLTLKVDEGIPVRFDGGLSTDLAYPGKNGVILDAGYSWDFDGDHIADATSRVVNWTFRKPGRFTVNLTVTDAVGWKSTNATMTAIVNDTKAPVPAWDILDPSRDWTTITSPMELKPVAFNASKTTDDYDKTTALNYTWTIPGPIVGRAGTNNTFYGMNISLTWREWNNSYHVVLTVKDTGFGSGKPNAGTLSRDINVQIDVTIHADLRIEAGTMKVSPTDPEEGAPVIVSVNVTDKPNRAKASNITVQLSVISGGQTTVLASTARWFDKSGNERTNGTIFSGETLKLVVTGSITGQGNKTVQVYVYDSTEPYTWKTAENRASLAINVRQPAWQPYAIWGSVVGVIVLFVFGMYARRKIKAGEWRPLRGRRGERGEGGEKKPRKEAKEEKKRL